MGDDNDEANIVRSRAFTAARDDPARRIDEIVGRFVFRSPEVIPRAKDAIESASEFARELYASTAIMLGDVEAEIAIEKLMTEDAFFPVVRRHPVDRRNTPAPAFSRACVPWIG